MELNLPENAAAELNENPPSISQDDINENEKRRMRNKRRRERRRERKEEDPEFTKKESEKQLEYRRNHPEINGMRIID